jgi:hypothetical protein
MSAYTKFLLLFVATTFVAFSTTFTFLPEKPGPVQQTPEFENNVYVPCNPGDPGCVQGDTGLFGIYGAQLTTPGMGNPNWGLQIEFNYPRCNPGSTGCSNQGTILPGSVIPPGQWTDGSFNSIADFLIHWNNQDYGVVLAPHIQAGNPVATYVGGNLYTAPNVQFDETYAGVDNLFGGPGVLPKGQGERSDQPVWLSPGGALAGAGTVSVALGDTSGNGFPVAYTVTDTFSAPAGFLGTGPFTAFVSSYTCANGDAGGEGGVGPGVPEPATFVLVAPALALFCTARRWTRLSHSGRVRVYRS